MNKTSYIRTNLLSPPPLSIPIIVFIDRAWKTTIIELTLIISLAISLVVSATL